MNTLNTTRGLLGGFAAGIIALGVTVTPADADALERFHIGYDPHCIGGENNNGCDGYEQWKSYHADGNTSATLRIEGWAYTSPGGSNNQFAEADLMDYGGGTGLINADAGTCGNTDVDCNEGGTPEHAVDNQGRDEFVLVEFDSADWALTHVGSGYARDYNDYSIDIQVWYWNGSGDGPGVADGVGSLNQQNGGRDLSGTDLFSDGWALLSDAAYIDNPGTGMNDATYSLAHSNGTTEQVQSTTSPIVTSKYWLVAPKVCNYNNSCGNSEDHFKLDLLKGVEVAGTGNPPPSVPEPGTALLLLAALPFASRRVRQRLVR